MLLLEQVRKVLLKFLKKSSGLTEILQLKHLKFLMLLAGLRHLARRNFHGFRKEWEGLKAPTGGWRDSGRCLSPALPSRAEAWDCLLLETLGSLWVSRAGGSPLAHWIGAPRMRQGRAVNLAA